MEKRLEMRSPILKATSIGACSLYAKNDFFFSYQCLQVDLRIIEVSSVTPSEKPFAYLTFDLIRLEIRMLDFLGPDPVGNAWKLYFSYCLCQGIEAGIYVAVAAALLAVAFYVMRRRDA